MAPAALITFRETIEAALVVAMIAGIFVRLREFRSLRTVALGVICAILASLILGTGTLAIGSQFAQWYQGKNEELLEGVLALATTVLVTWAVLTLDKQFRRYKMHLIQQITSQIESHDTLGIFFIAFTSVFREAVEIILLLSTMVFTTKPIEIAQGFGVGLFAGLIFATLILTATIKLPVRIVFRVTTYLLVFFAAGLLGKGMHELVEYGLIPELFKLKLFFIPARETFIGSLVYALFGLRNSMDALQMGAYGVYVVAMIRLLRRTPQTSQPANEAV
jgi:high-affinity iron transporter